MTELRRIRIRDPINTTLLTLVIAGMGYGAFGYPGRQQQQQPEPARPPEPPRWALELVATINASQATTNATLANVQQGIAELRADVRDVKSDNNQIRVRLAAIDEVLRNHSEKIKELEKQP